jgi:guanine nucleotide-binding protein G(i) subunit alpha
MVFLESRRAREARIQAERDRIRQYSSVILFEPVESVFLNTGSESVDAEIAQDRIRARNDIKILLFGSGNSGSVRHPIFYRFVLAHTHTYGEQSNILEQMRNIAHGSYTREERESFKRIIFANAVQRMRTILDSLPLLELTVLPENVALQLTVLSLPFQTKTGTLPADVIGAIVGLWEDPSIRQAINAPGELLSEDLAAAIYCFNSVDRMASPEYMLTDEDILHSRVGNGGIIEVVLSTGELTYTIYNASPLRSARRKWIPCFEQVTAIVFVASLADYDQVLYESAVSHRSMCSSTWSDVISELFARHNYNL